MERLVAHAESYAFAGLPAGTHLGMPSPTLTVVVSLDDPIELSGGPLGDATRRFGVSVAGLHNRAVTIHHVGRLRGFQLDLTPAGCRAVLGCPAGDLAEQVLEGAEVLGHAADRLRDQLHAESEPIRQSALVAAALQRRAGAPPMDERLARAWRRLLDAGGRVSVADLASEAAWSRRQFTDRFTREFGQGPKAVGRLLRFTRSRAMVQRGIPAVEVAVRCGYADQPHLVREWRAFTGTTPGRWRGEDDLAFVQDAESPGRAG